MRINLKKRFTALMLAGMMVTSNVLPAYSATDGIAVEQADASYEGQTADSEASADAGNSEAGGASSEQDDTGKPVADAVDSDSTTDASDNAEISASQDTSEKTEHSAASVDTAKADSAENTDAASDKEDASDSENTGAASGTESADTSENTGISSGAENTNEAVSGSTNTGAASGSEKSDVTVLETSAASTETETTGAADENEETKPGELFEEETKLATESEIPKEEDEKKLEEKENRKTIYIGFGKGVKVTATLEDANAVPDDARLRVSEIEDDEMYAAYLEAMDEAEPEIEHTKDNTVLRDISFIMKDEDGEETEYEPTEGSVKITIEYLENHLQDWFGVEDAAEVKTYHLPLAEGVKAEGEKTIDVQNVKASDINVQELDSDVKTEKTVEVEVDSFSMFAMRRAQERTTAYTTDSTPINLMDIKSDITATAKTTGELDRNAKISFDMTFAVNDDRLADTVKTPGSDGKPVIHNVWVYDLSSFFADKPLALVNQSEGPLYDDGTQAGTYRVEGNKVFFTIDPEFLNERTSGIYGGFNFMAQVDSEKIGTRKEYEFTFTGVGTATKLTFKDVTTTTNKYCENGNGSVVVTSNADGSATLTYHVTFKADASLKTLMMHDELSGDQSYDVNSFQIAVGENWDRTWNSVPRKAISIDGKKADIDVLKALSINTTEANTQYEIRYTTTVKKEDIGKALSNSAHWKWDGTKQTEDKKVDITVHKKLNVTKTVNESGGNYTYTIKVGGPDIDMKGHTIKDTMSDNQVLVGDITIQPKVNGQSKITPSWKDDGVYGNAMTELFTYTFPSDKEYKVEYTITYSTKLADSKQLSGTQSIQNTVTDEHDGDKGSDSTNSTHDFGKAEMATITKKWAGWDLDGTEKALTWNIDVRLPEGVSSLNDVYVSEVESKYDIGSDAEWNRYKTMSRIDLSAITVEDSEGNLLTKDTDYTVDTVKNEVHFSTLTKNVTIKGIRTVCPVDFTSGGQEYWFSNKAKVRVDGRQGGESEDKKRYVSSEWSMSKSVVHNEADDTYTWTVIINPEKAVFDTDKDLIFEDEIPDGMKMIENLSIQTEGKDFNGQEWFWGQPSPNVEGNTGTYHINITEEWKKQESKKAPNGLSGVKYTLTYKTKLTDAARENEKGKDDTFTYKNVARAQDGTNWKGTDCTVTRQYKFLEKKDLSPETILNEKHDVIEYQIVINPDALTLNEGNDLVLTDTIPEGTTFISNDYSFDPDIKDRAKLSLNSATRELKIIVPDNTRITFRYKLKSDDLHLGGHVFKNTATLTGKGAYTDYVEQNHIIKSHSATITGETTSINIHKYDEEALTKNLSGAVFNLYKLEVASDGTVSNTTEMGTGTTDSNGKLTFTGLTPLNSGASAPYVAYKFVETQAPEGYEINEAYNAEHGYYFVFYTDADTKAKEVKDLIEKNKSGITVEVVSGAHTFDVSNKKPSTPVLETGSLKFTKSFAGDEISEENLQKIKFTVKKEGETTGTSFDLSQMTKSGQVYEKQLDDLTPGKYTVTEENAGVTGYSLTKTYEVNGSKSAAAEGNVVKNGTLTIAITNTYNEDKGSLKFTKSFAGDEISEENLKKIKFTVKKEGETTGTSFGLSDMTKSGQVYEKQLDDLTLGKYTVTETNAGVTGYSLTKTYEVNGSTSTAAEGNVVKNEILTIKITNTYSQDKGSLKFTKSFAGDEISEENLKKIKFAVKKEGETTGTSFSLSEMTYSSTSKAYEKQLDNLTPGRYTVTETNAGVTGYSLTKTYEINGSTSTAAEGTVEKDNTLEIVITNTYDINKHPVVISKTDAGGSELDGAVLELTDGTGALVDKWTSTTTARTFELKPGTYKFHEVSAPSGYLVADDITFTVAIDGTITVDGKTVDKVVMIDRKKPETTPTETTVPETTPAETTTPSGGGGGGGGEHPHPLPETTPAETTPAETTVPETTPVETTTSDGGNGGNHGPSEEVETDEYGRVRGANRGKNKNGQDGGNVKGANRGKTRTGDESRMSIFGFGFLAAVLVLLGWFGIRFTKRNRR